MSSVRSLTETALLAALIAITGSVKLPGLIPGTDFQLSAPLAVAVCAVFGFKRYFIAGLLASAAGLMLGTQTLFHVAIALIFRLTVGAVLAVTGCRVWPVILAGPLGTILSRLATGAVLGQAAVPLLLAALPGMVYTAFCAWPLTKLLQRVRNQSERRKAHVVQR